jgi:hypothetical protein
VIPVVVAGRFIIMANAAQTAADRLAIEKRMAATATAH